MLHSSYPNDIFRIHMQSLIGDEQLSDVPILILGNKIDLPGAQSEDFLRQYFNLYGLTTGKVSANLLNLCFGESHHLFLTRDLWGCHSNFLFWIGRFFEQ